MDLHQLRGFYEIARTRSFTRAADKLFLASRQLVCRSRPWKSELGEPLFDRKRREYALQKPARCSLNTCSRFLMA